MKSKEHLPVRRFSVAVAAMVMIGCAASVTPEQWRAEDVSGLRMRLVSTTEHQELSFIKEGYVALTIGSRNGLLAGPLYEWRVVNGGLRIGGVEDYEQLLLVSRTSTRIVVRKRSGALAEYELLAQ